MKNIFYERLICGMLFTYALIVLVARILFSISFLPEIGGGMSINMLYGIIHLHQTGLLYVNPEQAPFSIIQYTPFYYHFIHLILKCIPGDEDLHTIMVCHRIICLSCNILYCIIISYTIKKIFPEISRLIVIASGLLIFILTPNLNFERIDNLYLLFSMISISSFIFYVKERESKETGNYQLILLSATFCVLALLTKQTAIWMIGLMSIWLLFFDKNSKFFFKYYASVLLLFFPLLYFLSGGNITDLKLNIVDGLKNGIGISWFVQVFIKGYFTKFGLLIILGLFIGGWKLFDKTSSLKSFTGFSILYFFSTALIFSLKYGATQNYYIEFTIMTIFGICYLLNHKPADYHSYLIIAAFFIPFLIMNCITDKYWKNISAIKSSAKDFKVCEEVANYISANEINGNYIYCNFHTENCLNLMLNKYALFPCREVAFVQTYPHGVFTFQKFGELLQEGKVQYIIDKTNHFPDKILYASPGNYIPEKSIGDYTIYRYSSNK